MARTTLETHSLTWLKEAAADAKLHWINALFQIASAPLNSPIPPTAAELIKTTMSELIERRDVWGAYVGTKLSSKIGSIIAVDDYTSDDRVRKLLAAQCIMLAPELELANPALSYDAIRYNYSWRGLLIEVTENYNKPIEKQRKYCVVHPDEDFLPIHLLGTIRVTGSCTQSDPHYGNIYRLNNISHAERMRILNERKARFQKLLGSG